MLFVQYTHTNDLIFVSGPRGVSLWFCGFSHNAKRTTALMTWPIADGTGLAKLELAALFLGELARVVFAELASLY